MQELQIIKTTDEEGKEVELKLLDIVNVDDIDYALLLPKDADPEADDAEVVLMRFKIENEEYIFETIDDDDEFDLVAQAIIDDAEENYKD
ncbi:MAG: DUF1292 domain-containing protein [Cyanobacteria bacterium SIG30]|nr:DUF1292 domain-containing protein [Cyanobacteria bacterium SIG30]